MAYDKIKITAGNGSFATSLLSFSNVNGVSFGTSAGGAITGSHNGLTTQFGQALSGSNGSFSYQTATFGNLNGLSFYTSNGSLVGSHNGITSQSVQTQSVIQAVYDGVNSISTGTVRFSNANGVSFGVNGQTITASHNGITSQSNQNVSLYALGNTTQNSSTVMNASNLSYNGLGNITVGFSNGSIQVSGSQSVQTQDLRHVVLSGNTAGVMATISSGTMTIAGGNNITVSQNGNAFTISGANVGGAQTGISGIVASDATYTSGTVIHSAQANITIGSSVNGASQYVRFSVAPQSVQPVAISGSNGSFAFSTVTFGSSNGMHFYTTNGSVVGSYTVPTQTTQPVAVSGSNGSFAFSTLTLGSSNGMHFYTTNGSVVGSYTVPSQTVQPVAVSGSNGSFAFSTLTLGSSNGMHFYTTNGSVVGSYTVPTITNSSWTVSDNGTSGTVGRLAFTNLNGVTLSLSTGAGGSHTIVGSHNGITSQTNQNVSLYALGNTTQNSSTVLNASNLSFNGLGNMTVGFSNGSIQMSVTGGGGGAAISAGANSQNTGTVNFANSNGVTFGLSNNGTMTASHNGITSQTNQNISLYALGNTTQNSSTVLNASNLSFNAIGSITMGYSNGSIQVSAPNALTSQSNQALSGSNGSFTFQTATFGNLNGMSFYTSNGSVVGSYTVPTQTVQPVAVSGSNGSFAFSTATFGNLNGLSFYTSNGSMVGSYTVPTQSNQTVGLYALGNTTQNSSTTLDARTMSYNALGAMTMGYSNGSIQVSAPNTSLLSAGNYITISTNGNTISIIGASVAAAPITVSAGTTSNSLGTIIFANANNVSFGLGTGASSQSVTASASFAQSNQNISLYALGNTTQNSSTVLNASNLSFNGLGNVTVGFSNGSVQISATGGGAGGGVAIAASNTTFTSGTVVMSNNGGALTISSGAQSVLFSVPQTSSLAPAQNITLSTNGSTISIGQNYPYLSRMIYPNDNQMTALSAYGNGSATIQYVPVPDYVTATRVDMLVSWSAGTSAAANTAAIAMTQFAGIYTRNGQTLSSLSSGSTQQTFTYASNSANWSSINSAIRAISVPININMTPGEYYILIGLSTNSSSVGTATTNLAQTLSVMGVGGLQSALNFAEIGSATNATMNMYSGMGVYSAALSSVPPTVSLSAINQTGTALSRANINIVLRNY